jgi:hypothetical protein
MGRAFLRGVPVEDGAFLGLEVVAEMPFGPPPMHGFTGLGDRNLSGLGVLDRDLALEDIVEAMLVEEGFPAVG